jgi:predicted DsbA family dithiol-disulfide isomerase
MIQRFGGPERVEGMQARLASIGKQENIAFNFDCKIGKTRDSHRLVELAGQKGEEEQGKVVLGLFEGYFEGGRDITDLKWIEKVGLDSGLDEATIKKWKEEDGGGQVVDRDAEKNKRFTNGVPNFTVNGKYVIEGAQDPEEFLRVFSEIADGEQVGATTSKDAC